MDAWREVGPVSNLNLKGKIGEKMGFSPIFYGKTSSGWVERERRETSPSLYDLQRSGDRNPSSQDLKFIY